MTAELHNALCIRLEPLCRLILLNSINDTSKKLQQVKIYIPNLYAKHLSFLLTCFLHSMSMINLPRLPGIKELDQSFQPHKIFMRMTRAN